MSLFYEDIKGTNTIYVDSREKKSGRSKEFYDTLYNHLQTTSTPKELKKSFTKIKKGNRLVRDNEGNPTLNINFKDDVTLEMGDFAYNDCVVEFKEWEDFKNCMQNRTFSGGLNAHYCDSLLRSGFKDIMIIIVADFQHYFNQPNFYKGGVYYGSKINWQITPSREKAFEMIIHFFKWNGTHLNRPAVTPMRESQNLAMNMLYAVTPLNTKEIKKLVKRYRLNTVQDVLKLKVTHFTEVGISSDKAEESYANINGECLL